MAPPLPQADRPRNARTAAEASPILIVPYMWIGDFVRGHSVVQLLRERFPDRPVDLLSTSLCAPLVDYMPGVRKGIVVDLPRKRLPLGQHRALAKRLRAEGYGTVLVMPRTWKAALAPALAGIPERIGYVGEWRFGLLNDLRPGERKLLRMIDQCAGLALPRGAEPPAGWPLPELRVPLDEARAWAARRGLAADGRRVVALAPGAVGPSKRWSEFPEAARRLTAAGCAVWVIGGPGEREASGAIVAHAGTQAIDLTSDDLRNAILALRLADAAVSNDSGLLHVAAAIGTPSVGVFGPTSPQLWAPLNPLAGVIQCETALPCQPCHQPVCALQHHRCMRDIGPERVVAAAIEAASSAGSRIHG